MPLLPLRYNGSNQITATSFHRHISSFAESATGRYLLCRIFSAGEEEEQKSQKGKMDFYKEEHYNECK